MLYIEPFYADIPIFEEIKNYAESWSTWCRTLRENSSPFT